VYTQQDLDAIREQRRKRWIALCIPTVVMVAAIIVTLVYRIEIATTLISIALGIMWLAVFDLHIKPLICYEKHLKNCLTGRTHAIDATYVSYDEEISIVDGVRYRAVTVIDNNPEANYERLFYFDVEKTFPDIKEGDQVHIVYHDRELVEFTPVRAA